MEAALRMPRSPELDFTGREWLCCYRLLLLRLLLLRLLLFKRVGS